MESSMRVHTSLALSVFVRGTRVRYLVALSTTTKTLPIRYDSGRVEKSHGICVNFFRGNENGNGNGCSRPGGFTARKL